MSPIDAAAAQQLREIAETGGYSQGLPTAFTVTPDGSAVLFLRSGPRDRVNALYAFDVASGKTRALATAEGLLGGAEEHLSAEEKARRERQRIVAQGIAGYSLSRDGATVLVPLSGRLFLVDRASGVSTAIAGVDDATDAKLSPDGKWVSFVSGHDVKIAERATGKIVAVTTGGTEEVSHGEAEFVAQEEMDRQTGYWWSPASAAIAWEESDVREVARAYIGDPANPAKAPDALPYPFAGTANAKVRLAITRIGNEIAGPGKTVWVDWDRDAFPYLARVSWSIGGPLTIAVESRRQDDVRVLAVDAATGKTRELLAEKDAQWVDLPPGDLPRWLDDGSGFLWMSQADGDWRLQLRAPDGSVARVLNPGSEFRLREPLRVDAASRTVIVAGSDDPVEMQVWSLSLDGGAPKKLTSGAGTWLRHYAEGEHDALAYVETFGSLKQRDVATVHRADGGVAGVVPATSVEPPSYPNAQRTKAGDFDALIFRPRAFVSGGSYPVIDFVYGGPSEGVVHDSVAGPWMWRAQWYADQGFVVVMADNRGIYGRGRAWSRAIFGDYGGVPLDDQVTAVKALCAAHPELDGARVGITGWSYGGFLSAIAVEKRGDVFKAAVAGAPVTDWSDYDTHYTERYLGGTPQSVPEAYRKSSVLTWAKDLDRPLLIFHGTADDNVYFVNSLKLGDALFHAGKPFRLVPIAGYTHMALRLPEAAVLIDGQAADFFRENL